MNLRVLDIAKDWTSQVVEEGDLAIDATLGNGHDCAFLAALVGTSGKVIGYDIQEEALFSTSQKLKEHGLASHVTLHQQCHSEISSLTLEKAPSAIMFNLGYLPGGNHKIITQSETTLTALNAALEILKVGGRLTVVCYPSHEGGETETDAVEKLFSQLELRDFSVIKVNPLNVKSTSPYLICVERRRIS